MFDPTHIILLSMDTQTDKQTPIRPRFVESYTESFIYPNIPQAEIAAIRHKNLTTLKSHGPTETLPELITFDGLDDPTIPRNWSGKKKLFAITTASLYVAAEPFIAAALPKSTAISVTSGHDVFVMVLTKIVPRILGLIIVGPLSNYFGRKTLLNTSAATQLAFSLIPQHYDLSFFSLATCSFLSTLGASCPLSVGSLVLNDVLAPSQVGSGLLLYLCGPIVSYFTSPVAVKLIPRAPEVVCVIMTLLFGLMPESSVRQILHKKAVRMRQLSGNTHLFTLHEVLQLALSSQIKSHLHKSFQLFTIHPCLYVAMLIGALLFGVVSALWAFWWA